MKIHLTYTASKTENYFLKKGMIKKKTNMETKEYTENKKNSHDSSIQGDSTVQWHQEAVLGSGE